MDAQGADHQKDVSAETSDRLDRWRKAAVLGAWAEAIAKILDIITRR